MVEHERMNVFLSHTGTDKPLVRRLGVELQVVGAAAYFPGYGPIVGCPACGAGLDQIEGFSETDFARDDEYAGARCKRCGWNDGGEL